ncbi:ATP-dependent DNA helicase PIF1 [Linum grandiflorum]
MYSYGYSQDCFGRGRTPLAFHILLRQFSVRTCYVMSINKSQGLTLDVVVLYLLKLVFSHGQLYVVVSKIRSVKGLHILIGNSRNQNRCYSKHSVS